ncbi:AFR604Cp [Eremothecium gossypii ATCC 10895]|uniref:AFR604Cp n=1 Tax=Eremothecium gossypii (strain ATCC 10895 / CBS 109.51 / FGSC 9923 / NRRL Y-1056) TaxID=284811 RepID=Q752G9_EREGS|nr:AFR604Cp [Eremothecium gossypii ATCC 10895]AAS53975.2 AFR604Cp [Eremothecium gossypii ATCC 10895]AEY98289.1 FAFR604Cp [Eremothecium gossypii FDAG1]
MSLLEQSKPISAKIKDPTLNPFNLSNYTIHEDSEITTSDEESGSFSSSEQLEHMESSKVLSIPTSISEKRSAAWFAGRAKSSGVAEDIKTTEAHPIVLTSFRKSISSFFRRDPAAGPGGDNDTEEYKSAEAAAAAENAKKKHTAELKSWRKWRGRHFHRKDGTVTEPEPDLERDCDENEWEKEPSFDTTDIGKIDVLDHDADAYATDYELSVKKNEVNYAKLTRIDIKDLYPDAGSAGQDADEEDAVQEEDESDVSSIEEQSKKLKVKFVDELVTPQRSVNSAAVPELTGAPEGPYADIEAGVNPRLEAVKENQEGFASHEPSRVDAKYDDKYDAKYDTVRQHDTIRQHDISKISDTIRQSLLKVDIPKPDPITPMPEEPHSNSMIYNFIYESPNTKNKTIDLWQVDHNSVTFGKFNEIIQLLNGDSGRIRFRDSLVEILDYALLLTAQKVEQVKKLESCCKAAEEKSATDREARLAMQNEVVELRDKISHILGELNTKKEELLRLSEQVSSGNQDTQRLEQELERVQRALSSKNDDISRMCTEWERERSELRQECAQSTQNRNACTEKYLKVQGEYDALVGKWKNMQFDYSRIEAEKKALEEKFHGAVAALTANENAERKLKDENAQLEVSLKTKSEALDKAVRANQQLRRDCQRERNKLLDMKNESQTFKKYISYIECYKNESLQFALQFLVNFRPIIAEQDVKNVQGLIDKFSKTKMWDKELPVASEEDPASNTTAFLDNAQRENQLITEMYQGILKQLLHMVTNKFIEGQRANKFLTQQLRSLRTDDEDKNKYIDQILQESSDLKDKLEKKRSQVRLLEETQRQIQAKISRLEKKLGKKQ